MSTEYSAAEWFQELEELDAEAGRRFELAGDDRDAHLQVAAWVVGRLSEIRDRIKIAERSRRAAMSRLEQQREGGTIPDPLEELAPVMERVWTIASNQGHRGIGRGRLGELAGAGPLRGLLAVEALEQRGCLVAVDSHTLRAAHRFSRR